MNAARTDTKRDISEGLSSFPAEKIQDWHRERLAMVYVWQSTLQQVRFHQESTR